MVLQRKRVTVASRVMLPTYVLFFTYLAANYTITPRERLVEASAALGYADMLLPMPVWGLIFAANAVAMAASMVLGKRAHSGEVFVFALWVGIVTLAIYALVFAFAAFNNEASPGAIAWPMFVATACYATQRSLNAAEV